jgi:hypothetical protein
MKFDREIKVITEFKTAFQHYLLLDYQETLSDEDATSKLELREKLNLHVVEVDDYVKKVGIPTLYSHMPHRMATTIINDISVLSNIFYLGQFNISPQVVIDILENAIGVYKYHQNEFKRKRFNPIYWIGETIRLPFYLSSFAGFDIKKIESSIFGKLWKFTVSIILFLAALVTIFNFCNIHLSDIFNFFDNSSRSQPPDQVP